MIKSRRRGKFAKQRAESLDDAREQWWVGLRDAEKEHYSQQGQDFARDEKEYRLGFEAALHLPTRGSAYEQAKVI